MFRKSHIKNLKDRRRTQRSIIRKTRMAMDSMLCCKKCYQNLINKFDEETANLWMAMCSHFVQYEGDFRVRESRIPWIIKNLTRLEKSDFITTCDNYDAIMVRVNGYSLIDGEIEMFCNDVEHESGIDTQDMQCV